MNGINNKLTKKCSARCSYEYLPHGCLNKPSSFVGRTLMRSFNCNGNECRRRRSRREWSSPLDDTCDQAYSLDLYLSAPSIILVFVFAHLNRHFSITSSLTLCSSLACCQATQHVASSALIALFSTNYSRRQLDKQITAISLSLSLSLSLSVCWLETTHARSKKWPLSLHHFSYLSNAYFRLSRLGHVPANNLNIIQFSDTKYTI